MKNLLHVNLGREFPNKFNAIVEIPKDTNAKYEYDPESGLLKLDRCLISSMRYPASYGFIPQTLADDNDPVDVLVYSNVPIQSLTLVEVHALGALHMIDDGVDDYKVLGMPIHNTNNYTCLEDLDDMFLNVCEDFFRNYKNNDRKKKTSIVKGWIGKIETIDLIIKKHITYTNNL
jgi:inorganic pyrophosphatase